MGADSVTREAPCNPKAGELTDVEAGETVCWVVEKWCTQRQNEQGAEGVAG
jgi:hypothetical protein